MVILETLQKFDAFAKAQEDFRTKTVFGGLITLLFIASLAILAVIEWVGYRELNWMSEIAVDNTILEEIPVALDISFPKVPCPCI